METWQFLIDNMGHTLVLAGQHAWIVAVAVVIAIFTGVPIGIWITFNRKAADIVLYIAGIIMSALLLSLGAPFWFNALRTLSSLRPILAGTADPSKSEES